MTKDYVCQTNTKHQGTANHSVTEATKRGGKVTHSAAIEISFCRLTIYEK